MKLRRIVTWALMVALMLTACGNPNVVPAPDDTMVRKDVADYISQILDNTATIVTFERYNDSINESSVTTECGVVYEGELGEYSCVFTLRYHLQKGAWLLDKCSVRMADNLSSTTAPTDETESSTMPMPTSPTATEPPKTEPPQTTPPSEDLQHHWKISRSKQTLVEGESFNLRVTDESGTVADVSWRASKSGIVSISGNRITALKEGQTKITGSVDGQTFTCVVTVKAKPAATQPPKTEPPATTAPPKQTEPPMTTPPTQPPKETAPPVTTEPPTQPPTETEPPKEQGKAPTGYSIRLSPSEVMVFQTFYVTVTPDVSDYTKIVIHAVDPNGGKWDFVITNGNSYSLLVDRMDLVGKWTIYADVYNDYGVFYGASSGSKAYLTVNPFSI